MNVLKKLFLLFGAVAGMVCGEYKPIHDFVKEVNQYKIQGKNLFEVFGAQDCSQESVKKGYRKLALMLHPDKNKDAKAKEITQLLNAAYDEVKTPDKLKAYANYVNRTRATGPGTNPAPAPQTPPEPKKPASTTPTDPRHAPDPDPNSHTDQQQDSSQKQGSSADSSNKKPASKPETSSQFVSSERTRFPYSGFNPKHARDGLGRKPSTNAAPNSKNSTTKKQTTPETQRRLFKEQLEALRRESQKRYKEHLNAENLRGVLDPRGKRNNSSNAPDPLQKNQEIADQIDEAVYNWYITAAAEAEGNTEKPQENESADGSKTENRSNDENLPASENSTVNEDADSTNVPQHVTSKRAPNSGKRLNPTPNNKPNPLTVIINNGDTTGYTTINQNPSTQSPEINHNYQTQNNLEKTLNNFFLLNMFTSFLNFFLSFFDIILGFSSGRNTKSRII